MRVPLAVVMLAGCGARGDCPPDERCLSQAGLYEDFGARTIGPGTLEFQPTHQLWSDGAAKRRWLQLPDGAQIDTTDVDHWQFPVGTRFWKEFARGPVLLETRLIERTGTGAYDFEMSSFVWREDEVDAYETRSGADDVNGTTHDVPDEAQCWTCHQGDPGRILGFSAVQLSPTLVQQLGAEGRLTVTPASYVVPGTPTEAAALGALHANCGHCHNPNGTSFTANNQDMRLLVADTDVVATTTYRTMVNQPLQGWLGHGYTYRISGSDPVMSAALHRMEVRGSPEQMPPIGSEIVDDAGLAAVWAWILTLPPAPP